MAEGDKKTFIFRTSAEFLEKFRSLEGSTDALAARRTACEKAGDGDGASHAASQFSLECQQIQDAILDEIERHWASILLDDEAGTPDFPDNWRLQFFGRILRIEYTEREAYKGR
ncbi:MAG: hypothetical protein KDB82_09670 [Planctomycetes bacterium]|nr:hypothetical protein [Planctomycetota bacterium]